jgi:flagellar basal-body rod modification protein FlgD
MDVSRPVMMSSAERLELDQFARDFNIQLNPVRQPQQNLGRDDFLKILITQLSYQDPTSPMEDKQFIAQMAQFSTLEQMTAMASDFSKLTSMLLGNEASAALGKGVEIAEGERSIQGMVQAVTRGEAPQVLVNGNFYDWENVIKVFAAEDIKEN